MAAGTTSALPSSTSSTLALSHPTRSELRCIWTLQADFWRRALSVEAYIRREDYLGNQDATRDGGIIYWVLIDTAYSVEAGQDRRILASCEIVRRKAFMAYENSGVIHVKECLTYGVERVFCRPEFRRRGYAKRMMRELKELLSQQGVGSGIERVPFSFLYSDIGKEFYALFDWLPLRSTHISLPSIPDSRPMTELPQTTPLTSTSLNSLCAADTKNIHSSLAKSLPTSKVRVAFVPDAQTMQWHHAREEFAARELFGKKPDIKGAIVGSEEGQRAWCIWEHGWTKSAEDEKKLGGTLYFLRLAVESRCKNDASTAKIASLIIAAQREAATWGLDVVEIWDPTEEVLQGAELALKLLSKPQSNVKGIHREKFDIASLQWHGGEPELEGVCSENMDWVGIERYAWC